MGSRLGGHVVTGLTFFLMGLWHLHNTIRNHTLNPSTFSSKSWYPSKLIRHLELYIIMLFTSLWMALELSWMSVSHNPEGDDGTISMDRLRYFEHASIAMYMLIYALVAFVADVLRLNVRHGLAELLGGLAFGHMFLVFHNHAADHMGLEGHYHWILQFPIFSTFLCAILSVGWEKSFWVAFVRAFSLVFMGIWFIVLGVMLWTPQFVPKGCFLHDEDGMLAVRCESDSYLERAKSLVNIQFSYLLAVVSMLVAFYYLAMVKIYGGDKAEYRRLEEEEEDEEDEVMQRALHMEKALTSIKLER